MSHISHPTFEGAIFSNNQIHDNARVHMGHVFQICNHDILADLNAQDQAAVVRKALYYHAMNNRKAQIENVEPETLSWIWNTVLVDWLEGDEPQFWITGKPASGKSTLMKYLAQSEETLNRLQHNNASWIVLHFYFDFRAGTGLPNSPLGLLRSFLDQLIDKCPELAKSVYARNGHRFEDRLMEVYEEVESILFSGLKTLTQSVCVFVDGLDEYHGSLTDLAKRLINLSTRTGIKLCMASRPDNTLRKIFENVPSIAMQQWNERSIEKYFDFVVSDVLRSSEVTYFRSNLLPRIVRDARGVILWARFAIDEIYDGLVSGAAPAELERIFENFPPDLEAVYERMLQRVSPRVSIQAALILALVEAVDENGKSPYIEVFDAEAEALCVVWQICLKRHDQQVDLSTSISLHQFRYRVHAILSGLVEFIDGSSGGTTQLRLCHKSVSSFLLKKGWIQETLPPSLQALYPTRLWASIVTEAVITASAAVNPTWSMEITGPSDWSSSVNEENRLQARLRVQEALKNTSWEQKTAFVIRAAEFEARFLRSLDLDYANDSTAEAINNALCCPLMQMQLSSIDFKMLRNWSSGEQKLAASAMFGLVEAFAALHRISAHLSMFQVDCLVEYTLRDYGRCKYKQEIFYSLIETKRFDQYQVRKAIDSLKKINFADIHPVLEANPMLDISTHLDNSSRVDPVGYCSWCLTRDCLSESCEERWRRFPDYNTAMTKLQLRMLSLLCGKAQARDVTYLEPAKYQGYIKYRGSLANYSLLRMKHLIGSGLDLSDFEVQDMMLTILQWHAVYSDYDFLPSPTAMFFKYLREHSPDPSRFRRRAILIWKLMVYRQRRWREKRPPDTIGPRDLADFVDICDLPMYNGVTDEELKAFEEAQMRSLHL